MLKKLLTIGLIAGAVSMVTGCKENLPVSLKVAHVNDTHGHFDEEVMTIGLPNADGQLVSTQAYIGGYPRLATKINEVRAAALAEEKGFMLLHGGDTFTGTLYFTVFKGELSAQMMNQMEFDAMVIGNHEFDLGSEKLAEFADSLSFPLLSANIKVEEADPLHGKYLPLTVKEINGETVAVVGLTTEFTEVISSPSDATVFEDTIETAEAAVKALESMGVNKIIFLTHTGLDEDLALAAAVNGVDVIIGGHTPEMLGNFNNLGLGDYGPAAHMTEGPTGSPVCIMHSGEYGRVVGVSDISFSASGIVESCESDNVLLAGDIFVQGPDPVPVDASTFSVISDYIAQWPNIEITEKDVATQGALEQASDQVYQFASTPVGVAEEPLYHVNLPGDTHPTAGVITEGSSVAPHVTGSMASKMGSLDGGTYVAVMNAGGVRADLEGTITVGSAFSVLPFSSMLVTMDITGNGLMQVLQNNVTNAFDISGVAMPYVANIQYTVDTSTPGAVSVVDVMVKSSTGTYEPLVTDSTYRLVTTSYLAGGGDFYEFPESSNMLDTGHVDADALIEYIESQSGAVLTKISSGITIQ